MEKTKKYQKENKNGITNIIKQHAWSNSFELKKKNNIIVWLILGGLSSRQANMPKNQKGVN